MKIQPEESVAGAGAQQSEGKAEPSQQHMAHPVMLCYVMLWPILVCYVMLCYDLNCCVIKIRIIFIVSLC